MDSDNLLSTGTGATYLAIFDGMGNSIIDDKYGVPIGVFVTTFNYNYTSEGPDEAEFTLETDNPDISSNDKLRYLMPIKLQWGYVTPDGQVISSPVRAVVVKDHSISFTPDGVKLVVQLSDASFITQASSATYQNQEKDLQTYVTSLLQGQSVPFQILDYSNRESTDVVVAKKVQ